MTYATELIQDYRSALQGLWNNHFWTNGYRDDETFRDFERMQPRLFRGLVARRIEPLAEPSESIFGPAFRAVPALQMGQIPTMFVNRKTVGSESSNWEIESGPFLEKQLKLVILDYFDWDIRNRRDFRYYRVRILAFESRPELIGCEALVDVLVADVVWNPEP